MADIRNIISELVDDLHSGKMTPDEGFELIHKLKNQSSKKNIIKNDFILAEGYWCEDQSMVRDENSKSILFYCCDEAYVSDIRSHRYYQDKQVVFVTVKDSFQEVSEGIYGVNPYDFNQVKALFDTLSKKQFPLDKVVIGCEGMEIRTELDIFAACFHLVKCIMSHKSKNKVKLMVPFRNIGFKSAYIKALIPFFKTVSMENPNIISKVVEVPQNMTRENYLKLRLMNYPLLLMMCQCDMKRMFVMSIETGN